MIHTLFTVLTIFVMYKILAFYLKGMYSDNLILLLTGCTAVVIAIYVPGFSQDMYLGQGNPNMTYSVTLTVVKPFMLLCLIFYLGMIKVSDSRAAGILKFGGLAAASLFISVFMKPSFALVFIPAVAVFLTLKHTRKIKLYMYTLLILVPTLLALLWQSYDMFVSTGAGYHPKFGIRPFYMWNMVSSNIPVSILLAVAFPLIVTLLNPKKAFKNNGLVLSWIMVVMGIMQYALLVEITDPFSYNGIWGYTLALLPLFVFSLTEFLGSFKDMWHSSVIIKTGVIAAIVVFLLHLGSGAVYFLRILNCGSFL
ncbi:MAG: hypothetical protein ACYDHZ_02555 [Dehalococcoidia bacterium]